MLYVSPQIVSKALKKAEEYMEAFDLSIERRPHYGMRLAGREYDIRRCLSTLSGENEYIIISDVLRNIVKQIFQKYDIKMSEMALTSFLMSVQIMIDRVQRQKFVELDLEKAHGRFWMKNFHWQENVWEGWKWNTSSCSRRVRFIMWH